MTKSPETPKPCNDEDCIDGWLWKQNISEFPQRCPNANTFSHDRCGSKPESSQQPHRRSTNRARKSACQWLKIFMGKGHSAHGTGYHQDTT